MMVENLILFGKPLNNNNIEKLKHLSQSFSDYKIVFLEDAVNSVIISDELHENGISRFSYLYEDLKARGFEISTFQETIEKTTYLELIDLLEESNRIVSML